MISSGRDLMKGSMKVGVAEMGASATEGVVEQV